MQEPTFESTGYVTQDQFEDWVIKRSRWDLNRYELLNGRIVMNPPAGYPHGTIEAEVVGVLRDHGRSKGIGGRVLGSSQGHELPSGDTIGADASWVSAERWDAAPKPVEGKFLQVVPDLFVEILSPSTASRDRGEKKGIYEKNGVREYWLIDPRAQTIRMFHLGKDGEYDLGTEYGPGESAASQVMVGLVMSCDTIFAGLG